MGVDFGYEKDMDKLIHTLNLSDKNYCNKKSTKRRCNFSLWRK